MCGIIGYIGDEESYKFLINGLKKLEYRGYDSAGFCTLSNKKFAIEKDIGKLNQIEKKINKKKLKGTELLLAGGFFFGASFFIFVFFLKFLQKMLVFILTNSVISLIENFGSKSEKLIRLFQSEIL